MKKNKFEAMCAQWLSECLDPNDKEGLAAFQNWMDRFGRGDGRSVTVRDVVAAWEVIRERQKLH
jgi:hypothetical protein